MSVEYVIQDASIKFVDSGNILQESLLYSEKGWVKSLEKATKYPDSTSAINIAKKLQKELPVRVLLLQNEGYRITVKIVNF